jgi:hypothetical protein
MTSQTQRICRTDPDASLRKGGRLPRVEPAYKQQTAVDAKQGVILDVEVTTGGCMTVTRYRLSTRCRA